MGSNPAKRAKNGRLAQLVRAPALHAGGQRFKSSTAHHDLKIASNFPSTGDINEACGSKRVPAFIAKGRTNEG